MKFIVFDAAGMPVRAGVCPDGQEKNQAREGETAMAAPPGDPRRFRLVDGEVVEQ